MKYGALFGIAALLSTIYATQNRGYYFLALWPATSFAAISIAYFAHNPVVFGKRPDGTIQPVSFLLLGPYLGYVWIVWHVIRLISREPPTNELFPGLHIGRRLLPNEMPPNVTMIVDLTCEFQESKRTREGRQYWSMPILDASIPTEDQVMELASAIERHQGVTLIHCAQGHGRTGTVASVVLLTQGRANRAEEAIQMVERARPKLRLNSTQRNFVVSVARRLAG